MHAPVKHIVVISSAVVACSSLFLTLSNPIKSTNEPISVMHVEKTKTAELMIDIEGAVMKPGVYLLPANSRVVEGIVAAGGITEHADRYNIARQLNLSKRLTDEEKIYIPYIAEQTTLSSEAVTTISINTASATQLELLPHIGTVTAEKIIQNRPFSDLNDLVSKRILSQKELSALQSLITL